MKEICVVCDGYPYKGHAFFSFVQVLIEEFSRMGINITIIAPQSITKILLKRAPLHPLRREYNAGDGKIKVYQPFCLSFGNKFEKINNFFRGIAIRNSFRLLNKKFDIIYAHFWHSALFIYPEAKKHNIPLFIASGEAEISIKNNSGKYNDFINYVSGVICVSTKNKIESEKLHLLTQRTKTIILPNAIDSTLFFKKKNQPFKQSLGIADDDFVVISVGAFIHRKGTKRLSNVIDSINNKHLKSIFIGKGKEEPTCKGIVFKGSVSHEKICHYLNAADVFVLPTLHEGCCNAIVEAMACGLPIISSNLSFNKDILNGNNSILVDPLNEAEIANAITLLMKNHTYLHKLSAGAIETASSLTIEKRAKNIISFITSIVQK